MTYELVAELAGTQNAYGVSFSDDGTVAVVSWQTPSGGSNGYAKVYVDGWDDPIQLDPPAGATDFGWPAIVSGDGSTVFVSGFGTGGDHSIWAYRGTTFGTRTEIQVDFPYEVTGDFDCSSDGSVLAVGWSDGIDPYVLVCSGLSWSTLDVVLIYGQDAGFGVSPDGTKIVTTADYITSADPDACGKIYSGANYATATTVSRKFADLHRQVVSSRGQLLAYLTVGAVTSYAVYANGTWSETWTTSEWGTPREVDDTGEFVLIDRPSGAAVLDITGTADEVAELVALDGDFSSEGQLVGLVNGDNVEIYEAGGGGDGWGVLLS